MDFGETVWSNYKRQIEADVKNNRWISQEKKIALILALRGKYLKNN